jgi:ABC-2 type transport system permease protein
MTSITAGAIVARRTRLTDLVRSERIKLTSIRSTRWTAALAVALSAAFVGLMAFGLSAAELDGAAGLEEMILQTFGPTPTLGAIGYALLFAPAFIGLLGALIVSTERGNGLLSVTVAAVPRRGLIVAAKLLVSTVVSLAIGAAIIAVSYAIAEPAFVANGFPATVVDAASLQVLVGGAIYLALLGTLSTGIAFLFRSTAAAAGAVLVLLLVLPGFVQLVPVVGPVIASALPTALGARLFLPSGGDWMSPLVGLAGLVAWAAITAIAARVTFSRSDV